MCLFQHLQAVWWDGEPCEWGAGQHGQPRGDSGVPQTGNTHTGPIEVKIFWLSQWKFKVKSVRTNSCEWYIPIWRMLFYEYRPSKHEILYSGVSILTLLAW